MVTPPRITLYKLFVVESSGHASPSTLVKVDPDAALSGVRTVLSNVEAWRMGEHDRFCLPASPQASSFVSVERSHEEDIALEEYQQHLPVSHSSVLSDDIY